MTLLPPSFHLQQAEHGSLPRPGVSSDGDKLLQLVHKLAGGKGGEGAKVEVDEGLIRKFASGGCVCVVWRWWVGVVLEEQGHGVCVSEEQRVEQRAERGWRADVRKQPGVFLRSCLLLGGCPHSMTLPLSMSPPSLPPQHPRGTMPPHRQLW